MLNMLTRLPWGQEKVMGYQVTARKWRPQTFDDIVEQRHVTRTLKNAIELDRVAHAYLFAGTRGVGKTTMARVLAKALNCERGPTTEPCNTCSSCLEIIQGASLDIVEIDGASNRGIDEIRDLRERLRYLPSRGRYKVYIIDEVHMLTKEAFNALLKTLEEPPPHVVFIFATTEIEKIPYTILSRCQRFEFKRVSLTGIVEQLEHIAHNEGLTVSRTSLLRVAKAAEGSMRDAQSLLDQVVAYCGTEVRDDDVSQLLGNMASERLAQCLQALMQQDIETALRLVEQVQSEGQEAVSIIRALLEGLRHLVVLKTTRGPHELIPLSEADIAALHPVADMASVEDLYGFFHVLSAAENSLRYASNPFLVLEMALVRMACIGRVQPLQALLDRLQHLGASAPIPVPQSLPRSAASGNLQANSSPALPQPVASGATSGPADLSPVAPDAPADFWQALQEYVAERRPSIAAFLQPGRVLSQTEKELVIGFAKQDSFCRETLLDPENLVVVREAVQAVLGRPLQVKIAALDGASGSDHAMRGSKGGPSANALVIDEQQRQKRETIQAVLDIFDGKLLM
jgi:DNA polymerase-3 subunit gamma/tau